MEPWDDGTTGIRTEQPELLHAPFLQDCDQEIRDEAMRRLTRQSLVAFAENDNEPEILISRWRSISGARPPPVPWGAVIVLRG